tara:strand:+ start:896 stop:1732 length:837 start_codon:yes stop_codon:yes gene_type:complete
MKNFDCYICEKQMSVDTEYTFKCKTCNFFRSSLTEGFGREIEGIDKIREINSRKIINNIIDLKMDKNFSILEIGSGNGTFVKLCEDQEINITGSEADHDQYINLKNKYKNILKVSLPFNEEETNVFKKYDIIIFNDVFEHLKDLNIVLIQLKKILNKDGYLIINIPSTDGLFFKISRLLYKIGFKSFHNRLWQKGLNSPHISFFNKNNLSQLLRKFSYELLFTQRVNFFDRTEIYKRIYSTYKNKFLCIFLTTLLITFSFIQKIFPADSFFQIYKNLK